MYTYYRCLCVHSLIGVFLPYVLVDYILHECLREIRIDIVKHPLRALHTILSRRPEIEVVHVLFFKLSDA